MGACGFEERSDGEVGRWGRRVKDDGAKRRSWDLVGLRVFPKRRGGLGEVGGGFGAVAGAEAFDDAVAEPEAQADAEAVVGLPLVRELVQAVEQIFEVEGLAGGGGEGVCGGVVDVARAAERLRARRTALGEKRAVGGLLDEVFLRRRVVASGAGFARLVAVGVALGVDVLLEGFDQLQGVANGLAGFGRVAQDLDEGGTELGEGESLVIGWTRCPIGRGVVRQREAHQSRPKIL